MICDLKNIDEIIKKEGLNLLVISYGGCVSNTLTSYLENNNYKIRSKTYDDILCHCPHYIDIDIPIIYIYDDPIKSFLSMKRRGNGYWDINQQKLSNNINIIISDENLLKLMINQFNEWTKIKRTNVLVLKSSDLFKNKIVYILESFLKKKIKHFPIPYVTPKTNLLYENLELQDLFNKYKFEIDIINNFKTI